MLGVNCLEPGQAQKVHEHADQDKFYAVQEGIGRFTVGARSFEAGPGDVVWAPAGVPHGVENQGKARLSILVGIAPAPAKARSGTAGEGRPDWPGAGVARASRRQARATRG